MSHKHWILIASLGAALILLLVGVYFLHPSRALSVINDNLEQGQSVGIATGITSQQLQTQLAAKERAAMEQDIAMGRSDSPYLVMGAAMAELMAERMAWERVGHRKMRETFVTPEGRSVFRDTATSFEGASRFVVQSSTPNGPILVLERKGMTWRVERIDFPD